jgi:hypothetical protein
LSLVKDGEETCEAPRKPGRSGTVFAIFLLAT